MKSKVVISIYIFLFVLYTLQNVLGIPAVISRVILGVILLISFNYFFKTNSLTNKPKLFYSINALLLMFSIYGFLLVLKGGNTTEVPPYEYLKDIYMSFLPIYVFYYFATTNTISLSYLQVTYFICIITIILTFFHTQSLNLLETTRDGATNNVGFDLLGLLPGVVILAKRPIQKYFVLTLLLILIIWSMKRGAILTYIVCLLWFIYIDFKQVNRKKRFLSLILIFAACFVAIHFVNIVMIDNNYFMSRIQATIDGDSSGRDTLYSTFFNHFMSTQSMFTILFGNGADYTWVVGGNLAHNDWLELIINNGLFGVTLFLIYIYMLIKTWLSSKWSQSYLCIGLFAIIFILKTLFSMSYSHIPFYSSMFFGVYLYYRNAQLKQ